MVCYPKDPVVLQIGPHIIPHRTRSSACPVKCPSLSAQVDAPLAAQESGRIPVLEARLCSPGCHGFLRDRDRYVMIALDYVDLC